jgi:hypothetical protein
LIRKLLLVILAAVVALFVLGDVAAKHFAESAIADQIHGHVKGIGSVDASIHSFPFVGRLVVQGKVPRLDLTLTDVTGHGVDVARLDVDARDIELDRSALVGSNHAKINGIRTMTVTATISEATVRALARADVHLLAGRATVTVAGQTVDATATAENGHLRFAAERLPAITVPIPDASLLPCQVTVALVPGALKLSCTSSTLPQLVIDAIGGVDLRH